MSFMDMRHLQADSSCSWVPKNPYNIRKKGKAKGTIATAESRRPAENSRTLSAQHGKRNKHVPVFSDPAFSSSR